MVVDRRDLDLNRRRDLEIIAALVENGNKVLDLGCGDGMFLKELRDRRGADVLGIEIDQDSILHCIANGVPVIQSNLNDDLDFADDDSFDLVVLSHTLQEMARPDLLLRRIVRVGRRAAVSVINFGHWSCRLQLSFSGRMPRTTQMPYHWFDTPNIHLCTLEDFRILCGKLEIEILQEHPIAARFPRLTRIWPNLFAVGSVFVLEKR